MDSVEPDEYEGTMAIWLTTGLLALLSSAAFWWLWRRRRHFSVLHSGGLPGPGPSLLFGNLLDYRYGQKPCHLVLHGWFEKYGRIYGFHMGLHRYVVVHDLNILQQVLIQDFRNYSSRPPPSISSEDFSDSVLEVVSHSRWKYMRSLMTSCLTAAKMKQMWPLVNQCVATTVQILRQTSVSCPATIDIQNLFQTLSCEVIAVCAVALKTNCQRDSNDPLLHRVRFFLKNASNPIIEGAFAFPIIAKIIHLVMRVTGLNDQMVKMIIYNLQEVMKQRRADPHIRYQDILQAMMDASEETAKEGGKSKLKLTDAEIRSNALVLLLAGYETTSNSLTFTAYLLAKHPHIQQRLYEEIVDRVGVISAPRHDQLSSLKYLDQVVRESLRLYPPGVTFVSRHGSRPSRLGDFQLPAGVNVLVPVWSIHHDPHVWPEPELFDPDRFSAEQKAGRHPLAWLPFGAGPRTCLGMRFGLLESKLTLVRVLQRFRLQMTDDTPKDLDFKVPTVLLCTGQVVLEIVERSPPTETG